MCSADDLADDPPWFKLLRPQRPPPELLRKSLQPSLPWRSRARLPPSHQPWILEFGGSGGVLSAACSLLGLRCAALISTPPRSRRFHDTPDPLSVVDQHFVRRYLQHGFIGYLHVVVPARNWSLAVQHRAATAPTPLDIQHLEAVVDFRANFLNSIATLRSCIPSRAPCGTTPACPHC